MVQVGTDNRNHRLKKIRVPSRSGLPSLLSPAAAAVSGSLYGSHMGHLLDIMHQAEQLPLRVYFLLAPQCEPIHSLVLQIPEHWFHNRYPLVIDEPAEERVELALHPFDRGVLLLFHTANKDGHLLGLGGLGCFKTTLSQRTRPAERLARAEADPDKPLD